MGVFEAPPIKSHFNTRDFLKNMGKIGTSLIWSPSSSPQHFERNSLDDSQKGLPRRRLYLVLHGNVKTQNELLFVK